MCLYPWHFYPEHREIGPDGKWVLKEYEDGKKYHDEGKFPYIYPPPRNYVQSFLDN